MLSAIVWVPAFAGTTEAEGRGYDTEGVGMTGGGGGLCAQGGLLQSLWDSFPPQWGGGGSERERGLGHVGVGAGALLGLEDWLGGFDEVGQEGAGVGGVDDVLAGGFGGAEGGG